jgi:hypothetical protein
MCRVNSHTQITDTVQCNYIMDNHNIKSKTNYRQAQEENHTNAEK